MKVIILCESSGVVREAFRKLGHDAWSCDVQPADDGSPYHFQCDMFEVLAMPGWEFAGMHPPCTFLCSSGIHWNSRGRGWERTEAAVADVQRLMKMVEEKGIPAYLENPTGILSTRIRKPDQYVQPYQFGEDASKNTGLWLHMLPKLKPTKFFPPRMVCKCGGTYKYELAFSHGCPHCGADPASAKPRWSNQTDSGQNKLGGGDWKERSRTYPGIAQAMAVQWTQFLKT